MCDFRSTGDLARNAPDVYCSYWGDDRDGDPLRPELRTVDCLTCMGQATDPADPTKWCPTCGGIGVVPVDPELIEIDLANDANQPLDRAWTDEDRAQFEAEHGDEIIEIDLGEIDAEAAREREEEARRPLTDAGPAVYESEIPF